MMQLTQQQRETIRAWLAAKRVQKCPACTAISSLSPRLLRPSDGLVEVKCSACGHVLLFDARQLGLIR